MKYVSVVAVTAIVALGVSCYGHAPCPPPSPSAAAGGTLAANADGSTLKVTAPGVVSPFDSERVDSRRPTLVWTERHRQAQPDRLLLRDRGRQRSRPGRLRGHRRRDAEQRFAHTDRPTWLRHAVRLAHSRRRSAPSAAPGRCGATSARRCRRSPCVATPTATNDGTVGPPRSISFQRGLQHHHRAFTTACASTWARSSTP